MAARMQRRAYERRRLSFLPGIVLGGGQVERNVDDVKEPGVVGSPQVIHGEVVAIRKTIEWVAILSCVRGAEEGAHEAIAIHRVQREIVHVDEVGGEETETEKHKRGNRRPYKGSVDCRQL